MNIKALGFTVALAAAALTAPAQGALVMTPANFNFTTGNNNNILDGNARYFSATSPTLGKFNVRVTGWSLETKSTGTYIRDSKLMVYSGGLGVIADNDNNGSSNQHTIDNHGRKDFLLFQFDRDVMIVGATFNTYSVLGYTKDSDAIFKYGNLNGNYKDPLSLNNKKVEVLDAMFAGSFKSLTTSQGNRTAPVNQDWKYGGDFWLIGADFANTDGRIDGFKLAAIAVIPEPETWAMMIGGFGLVGGTMRRRAAGARVSA
jgi:hypothetical protein